MSSEQITAPVLQELLSDTALAGEWTLDASRSTVSLLNSSMWGLVPVRGVFREVAGSGTVSPGGEVSGVLTVAAASVDTKVPKRDKHLRSADFFDSDIYPDITFTVESMSLATDHGVTVSGLLTVRDRARPLTFEAAVDIGDNEVSLDAQVRIDHTDFGITWNLLGTVSTKNTMTIHAVFTKQ